MKKIVEDPGKVTGKRLAKALPDYVERLEQARGADNNWQPPDDDNVLENIMFEALQTRDLTGAEIVTKKGQSVDMFESLFGNLAKLAIPDDDDDDGSSSSRPHQDVSRLRERIALEMRLVNQGRKDSMAKNHVEDAITDGSAAMKKLQEIFDIVIEGNKEEIVNTCYNGDEGAFLRSCTAYKCKSWEEFQNAVKPIVMADINTEAGVWEKINSMENKLFHAAREVSFGMHKTNWICWQCGAKAIHQCSRCQAARYCNRGK